MQSVANLLPWCAVLFLPNLLWARDIFPWMASAATAEADPIGYLGARWFLVRAAAYWAIWTWLTVSYKTQSSHIGGFARNERQLRRRQRFSGPAMVLFAITTTFAGFDWFMSLQPHWHSAIFGVYIFAGAVPSSLAVLAVVYGVA